MRRSFYIFHLKRDFNNSTAHFSAVSEFTIAYPALSFAITNTIKEKNRKYNQLNNVTNNENDQYNASSTTSTSSLSSNFNKKSINDTNENESNNNNDQMVTILKMNCIQTKQYVEMQIFLSGEESINAYNNNNASPPPIFQNNKSFASLNRSGN
jgi:hypothetical protein